MKTTDPKVLARLEKVKTAMMEAGAEAMKSEECNEVEILAILSLAVGECIAMQDSRTMTRALAMDIVYKNIVLGNENAMEQLGEK